MEQMSLVRSHNGCHNVIDPPNRKDLVNGNMNKVSAEDRSIHGWYRFVLSFPPHLVDKYVQKFRMDGRMPCVRINFLPLSANQLPPSSWPAS